MSTITNVSMKNFHYFSCKKVSHIELCLSLKTPDYLNMKIALNSILASGDFCHLLITFANSLDPDQDWQYVGHDLDPNCLTYECLR